MNIEHSPPVVAKQPSPGLQKAGRRIIINTAALAGSNLWRILVSFVLQLLIARRLGVEALGVYAIALAYVNVGQVVSEVGLPGLLVRDLARSPELRRSHFRFALGVQSAAALLTWGGLALLAYFAPFSPTLRSALWLIGASLPFYAVTSATQTLFQAAERMELVMGVESVVNSLILAASVVLLWRGGDVLQLMGVLVGTQLISALLGLFLLRRGGIVTAPQSPALESTTALLHRAAPFYLLSLVDILLQRVDLLLLSVITSEAIAGLYSAVYNLVRVLLKLVQSFLQALYPTLSRLRFHASANYRQVAMLSLRLGMLCLGPALLLAGVAAVEVLDLIYGALDPAAAAVLRLLLWTPVLLLISGFIGILFLIEQSPRLSVVITTVNLVGVCLLLPGLTAAAGAKGTAWAMVIAAMLSTGGSLLLAWQMKLPVAWAKLCVLVAAIGLASWLGALGPGDWWLRVTYTVGGYALIVGFSRQITRADWHFLRAGLARK